jgi:hypothetical protein
VEAVLLEPFRQEVVASELELPDEVLEQDAVESCGRATEGSKPFLRDDVDEHAFALAFDGRVLHDFDADGDLAVDGEQGDGDGDDVVVFVEEFGFETVFGEGVFEDGVFDVSVAVVVGEGSIEGEQFIFFGDDFDVGK